MEAWPAQLSNVREGQGKCAMNTPKASRQIDIDWIAYDKKGQEGNDNRFAVLMMPFSDTAPDVKFTALQSPPGTAALRLCRGETTDILVFGNGNKLELLDGQLVTDGAFAWIHKDAKGQRRGRVVEGKTLNWNGQPIKEM
jgi:hypothetical protein